MSLVVEFKKGWRVWMLLLQMNVVNFRLFRGESTVLTDVNLIESCVSQGFHSQLKTILPLISAACIRIDEQLREPLSSDFPENISE